MYKKTLIEDMMRDAVTDAKLFRTYDDDYEVIDRDQVMRCLANLDDAIKGFNLLQSDIDIAHPINGIDKRKHDRAVNSVDAIFTALRIIQDNLRVGVEHEAEEALKSKREMDAIGGKK